MYIQYKHKHRVIHIFIHIFLLLTCTFTFLLRCFLICWHVDIQVACFYSDLCTHRLVAVVAMWFGPFLGAASTSIVAKTIYVKDSVLCIARSGPCQTGICLTCKVLNVTKDSLFYTSWFCSCSDLKIHKSLRLKIATRLTTLRHFTREFGKQTQLELGWIRWNARILPGSVSCNELASQTGTCMLMLGQKSVSFCFSSIETGAVCCDVKHQDSPSHPHLFWVRLGPILLKPKWSGIECRTARSLKNI